ncbi:MAG: hypothetical protein QXV17_05585 [Candidatus Micrarchaeaceae archaeon]
MKRIVKILLKKATDSLLLSIELYNRPYERGRVHASLILLDHSFEMLLKASLLHRGARIYDRKIKQTIGFDKCIRLAISEGSVGFLRDEQAITLQVINSMRDAEQHYFVDIPENQHYILMQAGVTLFKDILRNVFEKELSEYMPRRVLPVSTLPPKDITALFENEIEHIKEMLGPKSRKKTLALAKLKALEIMESAIGGESAPITETRIRKKLIEIQSGKNWQEVFPGVASINITSVGVGPSIDLRFTKKEGIPIHVVPEGTPGAPVVGIKRVDELSFYSLGRDDLAEKVGLTGPKTTAVIWFARIKEDSEYYKQIKIGKAIFNRYSPKAIERIKEVLKNNSIDEIWNNYLRRKT